MYVAREVQRSMVRRRLLGAHAVLPAIATVLSLAMFGASAAERFPVKPVRIVVPFPAGGSTDLIARQLGQRLAESWGQPVLIDNRSGAGGVVGSEMVARAAPDGYAMVMGSVSTHAII